MQLASVAKANNVVSFESLKSLLIYFAQCQFYPTVYSYSTFAWPALSDRKSQESECPSLDKIKMSCGKKLSLTNESVL